MISITIMALEAERGGSLFLLVQGGHLRCRLTPALGTMDIDRLREAANRLEQEVEQALAAGYANASCVLSSEVRSSLRLAKDGQIHEPIQLQYNAGVRWNFSETSLGECRALEEAWVKFRSILEGWESSPAFLAFKARGREV